jgi:hypothetical protein
MKDGLDYFPHKVDSRYHWKFKLLRKRYGFEGEGRFWLLNCIIAGEDNVRLNLRRKNKKIAIAEELELSVDEFNEFISFLKDEVELIKQDDDGIWTEKVEEVYSAVSKRRMRQKKYREKKAFEEKLDNNAPTIEQPTTPPNDDENIRLIKDLMAFFGFNEVAHYNKFADARRMVRKLHESGHLEHFMKQWYYYKKYKKISEEKIHSWIKFIDLDDPLNGGWNSANWKAKYESTDKTNNDPSRTVL